MNPHRIMRILLACLMAVWSPTWCQCMILAAAQNTGSISPNTNLASSGDQSFSPDFSSKSDEDICCESESLDDASMELQDTQLPEPPSALAANCCSGECNAPSTSLPCQCLCCGQELIAAPVVPQVSIDAAVVLAPLIADIFIGTNPLLVVSQSTSNLRDLAITGPPATLLGQRCLLLI